METNIKCGNSLIDEDYYDGQIAGLVESKITPFCWKKAFADIIKAGGFDCVIGNPPYVRQELLGDQKEYFLKTYKVAHGTADLYSYFIERGILLLKEKGIYGIIVANKWMRANYGEPLRRWLKEQAIYRIIDFGDLPVFESATTYPCILIAGKPKKSNKTFIVTEVKSLDFVSLEEYVNQTRNEVAKADLDDAGWNLAAEAEQKLLKKLQSTGAPLGEYVKGKVYYGIKTGLNEAFVIDNETRSKLIRKDTKSAEVIRPFLAGRDIKRYQPPESDNYLILLPKGFTNAKGNNPRNAWKWLEEHYSAIAEHLKPFAEKADKRCDKGEYWWELRACDYYAEFDKTKIIYPNICKRPEFTFDVTGYSTNQKCFIISVDDKYLLGILNSKLYYLLFQTYLPKLRGGFFEPSYVFFKNFPVALKSQNKTIALKIEEFVDKLLELQRKLTKVESDSEKDILQRKTEAIDTQIDKLVYELYGLTEDEIKIVEGSA